MKIKKLFSTLVLSVALLTSSVIAYAAEEQPTTIDEDNFVVSDIAVISNGNGRSADIHSYGEGLLMTSYTTDTHLPRAYTITRTYNSAKYDLTTKIYCYDMLGYSYTSEKAAKNATSVVSGLLTSPTSTCSFNGDHTITISSGETYQVNTYTEFE